MSSKVMLVAGAAGFVPSHVCEFYLKKDYTVIGLDNFITGSKSNIERLSTYDAFSFYECNIYKDLPDFSSLKIDYVLSLASPASPVDFKIIPLEIMMVNSTGTLNLLELAKKHQAIFLEASTSEVYGDPEIHPQPETYFGNVNSVGPRSCYDESKRFAEALTMTFHHKYNVDTRIVRIFNTYGPGMRADDGRVIPNFINQALLGKNITVYGDGSQTRSFCYVDDLVKAMDIVLHGSDHSPINIGNPDEYSIVDTADFIINSLNSKSKKVFLDLPKDDPKQRRPDISKLQKMSDYKPSVDFETGIQKTADYFLSRSNKFNK